MWVNKETRQVPVTTYKDEVKIVLELDPTEAAALTAVCARIGGWRDDNNVRDTLTDKLYHELTDLGFDIFKDGPAKRFYRNIEVPMQVRDRDS